MAEIGPPSRTLLERLQHLFRGGVLQHIAGGAELERAADDDRVRMHGEDENRRALVVQPQPADEGKAAEGAGAHGEIDDDHVRASASR